MMCPEMDYVVSVVKVQPWILSFTIQFTFESIFRMLSLPRDHEGGMSGRVAN